MAQSKQIFGLTPERRDALPSVGAGPPEKSLWQLQGCIAAEFVKHAIFC